MATDAVFSLSLSQAKAFDKKTSVLQYFVKLVKRNDKELLGFPNDLIHVGEAELIVMDSLYNDMKELEKETEKAHETAKVQAEQLSKEGMTKRMSISELREQRTLVRNIAKVPQYNKMDHLTGRTAMERFTLNAHASIKDAMQLTEEVKEKFRKLLEYFGEDQKMASNDFFGTMKRFITEFRKAIEQVEKDEQKKVRNDPCLISYEFERNVGVH